MKNRTFTCASVFLTLFALPNVASAQAFAVGESVGHGNQDWHGPLGIDFQVNTPLPLSALGAYNTTGNPFQSAKTVEIWDLTGGATLLASLVISPTDTTSLNNGFRYKMLTSPLVLPVGTYTIDAYGFDGTDLNYNTNVNSTATIPTLNTFGGAVTWVPNGTGAVLNRFGNNSGQYPSVANTGVNWYLGNGSFQVGVTAVPEPGSIALLVVMGMTGAGFLSRRLKNARQAA